MQPEFGAFFQTDGKKQQVFIRKGVPQRFWDVFFDFFWYNAPGSFPFMTAPGSSILERSNQGWSMPLIWEMLKKLVCPFHIVSPRSLGRKKWYKVTIFWMILEHFEKPKTSLQDLSAGRARQTIAKLVYN